MKKLLTTLHIWVLLLPLFFGWLGAALNQAVLITNHDKFPVLLNESVIQQYKNNNKIDKNGIFIDGLHCVMTDKTHLNFLADVFDLKVGWYSFGDFLLMFDDYFRYYGLVIWISLAFKDAYVRE